MASVLEKAGYKKNNTGWEHEDAGLYKEKIVKVFGIPDEKTETLCRWFDVGGFKEIYIKDESINHEEPMPHKDFVYSVMDIDIKGHDLGMLAEASESIMVDLLKKEVTARCHYLLANAITLGFVQDLLKDGYQSNPKNEYTKRILTHKIPDWYKDEMGEMPEGENENA